MLLQTSEDQEILGVHSMEVWLQDQSMVVEVLDVYFKLFTALFNHNSIQLIGKNITSTIGVGLLCGTLAYLSEGPLKYWTTRQESTEMRKLTNEEVVARYAKETEKTKRITQNYLIELEKEAIKKL
eukprot:TRINITY_DN14_c0_g1_i2.p1 TRINITY_DN14_c0_g1~~TRINITY_DN14_c0_g1_i2.p1  ORF type:complete len:126 (-),score=19.66 TRINITY_DN14_c0_g1_i2:47-424(-)